MRTRERCHHPRERVRSPAPPPRRTRWSLSDNFSTINLGSTASIPSNVQRAWTRPRADFPERASFSSSGTTDFPSLRRMINFWAVSPPTVRMGKMPHEFFGRLPEHVRLRPGFVVLVHEPVDSSFAGVLVDFPLVDDSSKITSLAGPVPLLNDSPVHINEKHRSVRCRFGSERSEVDVFGAHEFTPRGGVAQDGHAILAVNLGATDEASDRFRNEEVAIEFLGKAVATENSLASHPVKALSPRLVRPAADHPERPEPGRWEKRFGNWLPFGLKRRTYRRPGLLKEERRVLSAARGIIDSSVVIRRKSPLPAAPRSFRP